MAKRDWPSIRKAYVEGCEVDGRFTNTPTIAEIGQIFGVPQQTIRKRSADEGWVNDRNLFSTKVEQLRQQKRSETIAARAADFDARALDGAEAGMAICRRAMNAETKRLQLDPDAFPNMDRMHKLAATMERFQKVGRLALGDTTEEQGHRGGETVTFEVIGGGSLSQESNG